MPWFVIAAKERVINNPRDTLQAGQQVRAVLQEKPVDKDKKDASKPAEKAKT